MDDFLKKQGYEFFPGQRDVSTENTYDLFQKRYDLGDCRQFINIKRIDMSPVYVRSKVKLDPISYSMETSFEMEDGKWASVEFYSFSEKLLREKLDEYEKKVLTLWTILKAKEETV